MASALFHRELAGSAANPGARPSTEPLFFVLPSGEAVAGVGFSQLHCFTVYGQVGKVQPSPGVLWLTQTP